MIDIDVINPVKLWYIVGFIAADGSLSIDGRHINITSKDREHLYKIRKALLLKIKVGRKYRSNDKTKIYSQLQIGSVSFYKFLTRIGFSPHKSLTIGKIDIDNLFFKDFLRGVIDGDGNISTWIHRTNKNRQWCLRVFSASLDFLLWINTEIKNELGVAGKIHIRVSVQRINPMYILKFGKKQAGVILAEIYYKKCLSLERKMVQAQLCLQDFNKNGKLSTRPGAGMVDSADLKSVALRA